jgi:hypothetical protein
MSRIDASSGSASSSSSSRSNMCVPTVMQYVPPYSATASATGSGRHRAIGSVAARARSGM